MRRDRAVQPVYPFRKKSPFEVLRMKHKMTLAARILLGLLFVVFGLNFFLHFIPMPAPEGKAAAFMGGLFQTGYFFYLLKITEILMGLLLLIGIAPAFALVVLAPIVLNIFF